MAAYLFQFSPLFKKCSEGVFKNKIGSIRNAYRSKKPPTENEIDGSVVKCSQLIYRDETFRYCPGLNAGIGRSADIYAKVPGRVLVTTEKTNFNSDHHLVVHHFKENAPFYNKYIHVIPEPQHKRFKLVEKF